MVKNFSYVSDLEQLYLSKVTAWSSQNLYRMNHWSLLNTHIRIFFANTQQTNLNYERIQKEWCRVIWRLLSQLPHLFAWRRRCIIRLAVDGSQESRCESHNGRQVLRFKYRNVFVHCQSETHCLETSRVENSSLQHSSYYNNILVIKGTKGNIHKRESNWRLEKQRKKYGIIRIQCGKYPLI